MVRIGSPLIGLYQDQADVLDQTAPPTAPDGHVVPEALPVMTAGGAPTSFVAHGVGLDTIGENASRARPSMIANQDLDGLGASIVNPARSRDGSHLRGPGTPEQAINAPRQGAILDSRGFVHLGIGPAIPMMLLLIVAGAVLLYRHSGPIIERGRGA